jgi:chromosomal replication initiator protein
MPRKKVSRLPFQVVYVMATMTPETLAWPTHDFLVLPENELAYAGTAALMYPMCDISPRLLYLHGASGSGKTHLIQELMLKFLTESPTERVEYLTASEFVYHLQSLFHDPHAETILDHFFNVSLLIIEDLHTIMEKDFAHYPLASLIDQTLMNGGAVVLSSLHATSQMSGFHPKLVSRCRGGVTGEIKNFQETSRLKLIQHYAELNEIETQPQVWDHLAEQMSGSPREILGAIKHLEALSRIEKSPVKESMLQKLMAHDPGRSQIKMIDIARMVAKDFHVPLKLIRSRSRDQGVLIPRQVIMYLTREYTEMNYGEIGEFFDIKSHTTVIHSCQKLVDRLLGDSALDHQVSQLKNKLQGFHPLPR